MAILNNAFPVPQALNILQIGVDNQDHRKMVYTLENPHPLYGKDPNIINELGHTVYPKMVYPQGKNEAGVLVKNAQEEANALNKELHEIKTEAVQHEDNEIEKLERMLAEAKARKEVKELMAPPATKADDGNHPWGQ